ncbi:hypothetical protein N9D31_03365 [Oligoflexaceae bacterium]|nr:hypothetical protein [Oligoflexaceae bacterium]
MQKIILLAIFLSSPLFALEGVYEGSITKADGSTTDLQLSLTFTGERQFNEQGFEHPVMAAAILLESEGGPYACSQVNIDFDESEVDIQYSRSDRQQGDAAADFRLLGQIIDAKTIRGRALSRKGNEGGVFGRFTLKKKKDPVFKKVLQYAGKWKGEGETPAGAKVPMEIQLSETDAVNPNPDSYEFAYTPGKIASMRWNRSRQGMDRIHVDYLRQKIQMYKNDSRGGAGISVEFRILPDRSIEGTISGAQTGLSARFTLQEAE